LETPQYLSQEIPQYLSQEIPQYLSQEMPYIPRETPHLLQGMPLSSTRDAPSPWEMHIPHTSCGISRRRYGVSRGRYCGISKILDM
jgi:hypothetical protein